MGWSGGIDASGAAAAHPALACLDRAWAGLAGGAGPPRRSQIDPRGIEPALGDAFVAERIAPGLARFRLAGHRLADLMGMDLRGMPLSALIEPDDRDAFRRLVAAVFEAPARIEARLAAGWSPGRPALDGALLLLPLRDEAGEVTRLLGGLAAAGSPGRAPRRFRVTAARATPVPAGNGAAAPARREPCATAAATGPGTEAARPARPPPAEGRPALRLVWSAP